MASHIAWTFVLEVVGSWGVFGVLAFKLLEIIKIHPAFPQHCRGGLGTQFTWRGQPHSGPGEQ